MQDMVIASSEKDVTNKLRLDKLTTMPSCRWQTRATRNHAEKCCSSTFK